MSKLKKYITTNFLKFFMENSLKNGLKFMTAEQAYSLATIKHLSNADDVFNHFLSSTLEGIKKMINEYEGSLGYEVIVRYPDYFNVDYKRLFDKRVNELGYTILYRDENICLLSWRYLGKASGLNIVDATGKVEGRQLLKG